MLRVENKYSTYYLSGVPDDDDDAAALYLLKERLDEGYWYEDWDDGDPNHQWETRARTILADPFGGKAALKFLLERRDHEYENVEQESPNIQFVEAPPAG